MTTKVNSGSPFYVLLTAILFLSGTVSAQDNSDKQYKKRDFCASNNYSYNGKVSFSETREAIIGSEKLLTVDGQRNGGIQIKGENRRDILVRACVQTSGASEADAQAAAKTIRIETGSGNVRAENTPGESGWSVSFEILVPRNTDLNLTARNGGIHISGVDGALEFETQNGGIHLSDVAGAVKGKTQNGGVHVALSGNSWKGDGLDLQTTNGGVHLEIPENYQARIETGTVNGGFKSDIAALNAQRNDRTRAVRINTDLNGGGAPIRLITTNGGVKISSAIKNL